MHYSLFIQITSFLLCDAWLDRQSVLCQGTAVTVELESDHFGALEPCTGAFYAEVHESPGVTGEQAIYSVKLYAHPSKADGTVISGIARERLRHRKFQTTATIGVTDEKRHDSVTTQHFLDETFKRWRTKVDVTQFWAWVGHSDNASHFKSGAMLN